MMDHQYSLLCNCNSCERKREHLRHSVKERWDRLRSLGFKEPTKQQQDANLSYNLMMLELDRLRKTRDNDG